MTEIRKQNTWIIKCKIKCFNKPYQNDGDGQHIGGEEKGRWETDRKGIRMALGDEMG